MSNVFDSMQDLGPLVYDLKYFEGNTIVCTRPTKPSPEIVLRYAELLPDIDQVVRELQTAIGNLSVNDLGRDRFMAEKNTGAYR